MEIRFERLTPTAILPAYAHPGDAGMDLCADAALTLAPGQRAARFVCVLALALPGEPEPRLFRGECHGRILPAPQGDHGFGYDPLFAPDGHDRSFGLLPEAVKAAISHRARAFARLRAALPGI